MDRSRVDPKFAPRRGCDRCSVSSLCALSGLARLTGPSHRSEDSTTRVRRLLPVYPSSFRLVCHRKTPASLPGGALHLCVSCHNWSQPVMDTCSQVEAVTRCHFQRGWNSVGKTTVGCVLHLPDARVLTTYGLFTVYYRFSVPLCPLAFFFFHHTSSYPPERTAEGTNPPFYACLSL